MAEGWPKKHRLLGTRIRRLDGPAKATGHAKYSYDINRKGMLHALMLRSTHAHATITSIDVSRALKVPGFRALHIINGSSDWIVTKVDPAKNTLELKSAPTRKRNAKEEKRTVKIAPGDTIIRANKVVKVGDLKPEDHITLEVVQDVVGRELFYAGDEILAVAADTEEHAQDALQAIKVDYKVLDFFVNEDDVLKDPKKKTTPGRQQGNLSPGKAFTKGDPDAAFKKADAVVEGTYGVPVISHQCLEVHGLVAEWDSEGGLTVWASTQATKNVAGGLAGRYGISAAKVKCITHYMGGGFGSKFAAYPEGFAAAELSRRTGAPVKFMLDREGEITTAGNRPSASGTVKIAGNKDGSITAFEVDCHGTPGYTGGATVNLGLLPYVYQDMVPNIKRNHTVIYTNAGGARAMRAPGHPQNCVLTEFAVDDLAGKLGIDPLVIRRKNLPPNNDKVKDKIAWAARRNDVYHQQLDIATKLAGWKEKWHPPGKGNGKTVKHGIGMGIHTWGGFAAGLNECLITIARDGSVTAKSSTQDLGTAQRTVTAIVTAEILGLMPTDITVMIGESEFGASTGSGGSTTCPSQAPATLFAAQAARNDLFKKVAAKVQADAKDLAIEVGRVVDKKNNRSWGWKEFCARLGMEEAKGKGVAFLSVLKPRNTGWRISPAVVHSVNLTSATSFGFTQVVFASSGTFSATGFLAVMSGTIFWCSERKVSALKPVPARPAYSQRFPSRTASTSAPKYLRLRRGAVNPTITTSCSWLALTFSQSRVRTPEW